MNFFWKLTKLINKNISRNIIDIWYMNIEKSISSIAFFELVIRRYLLCNTFDQFRDSLYAINYVRHNLWIKNYYLKNCEIILKLDLIFIFFVFIYNLHFNEQTYITLFFFKMLFFKKHISLNSQLLRFRHRNKSRLSKVNIEEINKDILPRFWFYGIERKNSIIKLRI